MRNSLDDKGFSLIEVIIALVIVIGLVAAFAGAMVVSLQSEYKIDNMLKASNLSSSIIEVLGEGGKLKEIINDGNSPSDYETEEINFYFDTDKNISYNNNQIVDLELDDSLFFEDINLGNSGDYTVINVIKYKSEGNVVSENLYRVTINIKWDDRGDTLSHEIMTLLAVN